MRALHIVRRHHLTLVSAIVLGVAAVLAVTSTGFERRPAGDARAQTETSPGTPAPTPTPAGPPLLAIVYLVTDEAQGDRVIATHRSLVWDTHAIEADTRRSSPLIHLIVAGTAEEEAIAVENLIILGEIADQQNVDLRVVDLRPDRRPAANTASP